MQGGAALARRGGVASQRAVRSGPRHEVEQPRATDLGRGLGGQEREIVARTARARWHATTKAPQPSGLGVGGGERQPGHDPQRPDEGVEQADPPGLVARSGSGRTARSAHPRPAAAAPATRWRRAGSAPRAEMVAGHVPQLGPIRRHAGGDRERRLRPGGGGQQLAPHAHQRAGREAATGAASTSRRRIAASRPGRIAGRPGGGRLLDPAISRTTRRRSTSRSTMAPSMRSTSRRSSSSSGSGGLVMGSRISRERLRDVPSTAGGRHHRARAKERPGPSACQSSPGRVSGPRRLHAARAAGRRPPRRGGV